jgi:hypothetical protein
VVHRIPVFAENNHFAARFPGSRLGLQNLLHRLYKTFTFGVIIYQAKNLHLLSNMLKQLQIRTNIVKELLGLIEFFYDVNPMMTRVQIFFLRQALSKLLQRFLNSFFILFPDFFN